MPSEALLKQHGARPHLRLVASRPLRVVDCALFYGGRSGDVRAYLDAKRAFAADFAGIEHHLLAPGASGPSLPFNRAGAHRLALGGRGLLRALEALVPDVVLLHDPFWKAREVCRLVHSQGGAVVMVHHGAAVLEARAATGPSPVYERALRSWLLRSYDEADAVMSAGATWAKIGRGASIPLRVGLHPAFRPQPDVDCGDHVLFAGGIGTEQGIFTLLEAAARSREQWTLRVLGNGPAVPEAQARAAELGIAHRLDVRPSPAEPHDLAREYAAARCVVVPGPKGTSATAAVDAAACGAPVVSWTTDPVSLLRAIGSARLMRRDLQAAEAFAAAHTWQSAFTAELRDLEALAGW